MNDKSDLLDQLKIDRSQPQSTGMSPWLAGVLMVVAAIVGGFGALWLFAPEQTEITEQRNKQPGKTASTSQQAVQTREEPASSPQKPAVEDRNILNASGYITARRIATVSSEITGRIVEVNVEEGMLVKTDQVLARLDNAVALVNLRLSEKQLQAQIAQKKSTEANLAEAKRVYKRAQELREKKLTSEADLTSASAQVDSLQAQLNSAKANIEVSRLEVQRQQERVQDHVIRAPFAGVVTVKNAQIGEIISPGSAGGGFTRTGICTLVDMESLEIEVDVNEAFIGRVFAGQEVEASLDAYPDWKIPAAVIAIIPTADRAKATVRVRIGIKEKDQRILPDMGVKVAFLKS